jgi:hypothetical protein
MWMYDDPSFNICVFVAKSVGGQSFRTKVTFFTTKYQPCESFPFLNKLLYCLMWLLLLLLMIALPQYTILSLLYYYQGIASRFVVVDVKLLTQDS